MDTTVFTSEDWRDRLEYAAEKSGYTFSESEGWITLEKRSPAGQDHFVELDNPASYEDAMRQIAGDMQAYDVDEETMLWYGAHKGEPQNLEELLDDMKWCKKSLEELSSTVSYYKGYSPADFFNEQIVSEALEQSFHATEIAEYSFSDELRERLQNHMLDDGDDPLAKLEELATYGCASGTFNDFIYCEDTKAFYDQHHEDVERFVERCSDELGTDAVRLESPRYNSAVWLVADECARYLSDDLEYRLPVVVENRVKELNGEQVQAVLEGNEIELVRDELEKRQQALQESKDQVKRLGLDEKQLLALAYNQPVQVKDGWLQVGLDGMIGNARKYLSDPSGIKDEVYDAAVEGATELKRRLEEEYHVTSKQDLSKYIRIAPLELQKELGLMEEKHQSQSLTKSEERSKGQKMR